MSDRALQRLEWSGKTAKGILLHRMKRKAEGRVRWAAHESTGPRLERRGRKAPWGHAPLRGCNRSVPWAVSLGR